MGWETVGGMTLKHTSQNFQQRMELTDGMITPVGPFRVERLEHAEGKAELTKAVQHRL